jgi:hypothetical protein
VIRFRTMRPLGKQILTYLVLVFAFSSVPEYVMIHAGHVGAGNGLAVSLVMWCPAFSALVTCWLFRVDLATLGWNWRPAKYEVWSYFIPILYAFTGLHCDMGADSRFVRIRNICPTPGTSFRISAIANHGDASLSDSMLCHRRRCRQHGTCTGRGNWLARISASAAGSTSRFYLGMPAQRLHLGGMALSSIAVR